MAGQKSPKREEFGCPSLDCCWAVLFVGLFAGHFVGLSPASFSPAKSPARGTERFFRGCGTLLYATKRVKKGPVGSTDWAVEGAVCSGRRLGKRTNAGARRRRHRDLKLQNKTFFFAQIWKMKSSEKKQLRASRERSIHVWEVMLSGA